MRSIEAPRLRVGFPFWLVVSSVCLQHVRGTGFSGSLLFRLKAGTTNDLFNHIPGKQNREQMPRDSSLLPHVDIMVVKPLQLLLATARNLIASFYRHVDRVKPSPV